MQTEVQAREQVVSLHIAFSFAVAIYEDWEAPRKPQNFFSLFSAILFSIFCRGFMNSFQASQIIYLAELMQVQI